MRVCKIELLYIDFDGIVDDYGEQEIIDMIENANLGNHVSPGNVMSIQSVDIGEWDDDNPLNNNKTMVAEFKRLFP